jgi:hypothetical protein
MWAAMLVSVLLMQQGAVGGIIRSPNPVDITLELTLAAPVQLPDGRLLGASVRPATLTSGAEPWFVYSRGHLCDSAITQGTMPTDATEGWRVSIVERARTSSQLTVGVTWIRMWDRGRPVTAGTGGTSELTLQNGDRIPLDQITRPSAGAVCAATQKTLELRLSMRVTPRTATPAANAASPEPDAPLDVPVMAELWMVHRAPTGVEAVEHQTVRLSPGGIGFMFRSLPIGTSDGPMTIELTGQLRAVLRADGSRGLWAGLTRAVTQQATGRQFSGSSPGKTVDWLAPGDVYSFDLPDPAVFAGGVAGAGGGGAGGRIGGGVGGGGAGTMVARSGGGGGGVATGGGGVGGSAIAVAAARGPNLLEGHKLSLRVRLIDVK